MLIFQNFTMAKVGHHTPGMYITKETGWHLLCHCQGNTLGSSFFLSKTKYPHLQPLKVGQRVLQNIHDAHIVLTTLFSRLLNVDDSWLRQKLGISVLVNTGSVAKGDIFFFFL